MALSIVTVAASDRGVPGRSTAVGEAVPSPQHLILPSLRTMQVWTPSAVTELAVLFVGRSAVSPGPSTAPVDAVPSCPAVLSPQQLSSPEESTAHVCRAPASTDRTPVSGSKSTNIGTGDASVLWPLPVSTRPSWPCSSLPQHDSVRAAVTAHEW